MSATKSRDKNLLFVEIRRVEKRRRRFDVSVDEEGRRFRGFDDRQERGILLQLGEGQGPDGHGSLRKRDETDSTQGLHIPDLQ